MSLRRSVSRSRAATIRTAAGKMVFRMLAVLAEFERDLVSERTRTAMQHLQKQGRRVGRWLPYGFDLDADGQHLTENPVEQRMISLIQDWHRDGLPMRTIADKLNERRIATKQGRLWTHVAVFRVLHGTAPKTRALPTARGELHATGT